MSQDLSYVIQTTKNGILDAGSDRVHVEGVVKRAIASGQHIVLHLHGGLVGKETAYKTINLLQPQYLNSQLFPVFIVWRTGIPDALKSIDEIAKKPFFEKLLRRLLKFFVGKAAMPGKSISGVGQEPDDAEIDEELQKVALGDVPFKNLDEVTNKETLTMSEKRYLTQQFQKDNDLVKEFSKEVQKAQDQPEKPGLDQAIVLEAEKEKKESGKAVFTTTLALHAVKIAGRIVKRFYKHSDHGLHATIMEEILRELFIGAVGTAVWGFMKQDAVDTFEMDNAAPERGGWLFLRLLDQQFRLLTVAGKPLPRFSIVAHSAGAIYACKLLIYLETARNIPGHPLNNSPIRLHKLTFLAPACRHELFAEVLEGHSVNPLFNEFRMYGLTDKHELGYFEVPAVYPASLLYLVSGLFEDEGGEGVSDQPLVGMQRYYRSVNPYTQPEVQRVGTFLAEDANRFVASGDQRGAGLECDSLKHGAFDESPKTISSILHFLSL